jgi:putative tryptophan/tyrosine transport system substrate-binding protein
MKRREFIALLSGTLASTHTVRAQDRPMPLIGFVSSRGPGDSSYVLTAFYEGLAEYGFVKDSNVAVEYLWADGNYKKLPDLFTKLISRRPAVLVAGGGEPAALAAKAASTTIPIVFTSGGDPVKSGLVASLAHPGGNATGISLLTVALDAKRLSVLSEVAPKSGTLGVLVNPSFQQAPEQMEAIEGIARSLQRRLFIARAATTADLDDAFAAFRSNGIAGLLSLADPFLDTQRDRIIAFAEQNRLPAVYHFKEYAQAGGLMSYGISLPDVYKWVGRYVGRILKGAAPSDLAVMQSVKFEHVINLRTARAIGIEIPALVLAQADEVIE